MDKVHVHSTEIKPVVNGFILDVGCMTFVFENLDDAFNAIRAYYDDPRGTAQAAWNSARNQHLFDKPREAMTDKEMAAFERMQRPNVEGQIRRID